MRTPLSIIAFAVVVPAQQPPSARGPDWIVAGPMLGHVGAEVVKVWVQVQKNTELRARGTIAGHAAPDPEIRRLGKRVRVVRFDGLAADQELVIQLYRGEHPTRGVAVVVRTAPPPAPSGRVRIGFGSGLNDVLFDAFPVLPAAARARPDVFLFVGDNTYYARVIEEKHRRRMRTTGNKGDWTSGKKMFRRQIRTRRNPWLQPLLRSVPCYGIWDDHDYGPSHADRWFESRLTSLKVFQQMWANPAFGIKGTKGCFSSFRRGPVEVFLMDCRYHKSVRSKAHPEVSAEQCTIWGGEQFRWLCAGLRASTAPIKLIANGTPVLNRGNTGEGHYQEARAEYRRLLAFLHQHRIGGVVFLTGDRQHSEMMQLVAKDRPLLLEFTSSPLGQGQRIGVIAGENHPATVWQLRGDSFGLVTVDVDEAKGGSITCEVRDASNQVPRIDGGVARTTWRIADLHYPRESRKMGSKKSVKDQGSGHQGGGHQGSEHRADRLER